MTEKTEKALQGGGYGYVLRSIVPCLSEIIETYAEELSVEDRVTFTRQLLDRCLARKRDAQAAALLELLNRAETVERANAQADPPHGELARLCKEWRRSLMGIYEKIEAPHEMPRTTIRIARWIIEDWVPKCEADSVIAFRELIGIGWPEIGRPVGAVESEVDRKVRGKSSNDEIREGILALVREKTSKWPFTILQDNDGRKVHPDEVFGPWLNLPNVPWPLLNSLGVARAKLGEHHLAVADVRHGMVLRGVPESGLQALEKVTGRMKVAADGYERLLKVIVTGVRETNVFFRGDAQRFSPGLRFNSTDKVTISFDYGEPDELFEIAAGAITQLRADGRFGKMKISLVVGDLGSRTEDGLDEGREQILTKEWPSL